MACSVFYAALVPVWFETVLCSSRTPKQLQISEKISKMDGEFLYFANIWGKLFIQNNWPKVIVLPATESLVSSWLEA